MSHPSWPSSGELEELSRADGSQQRRGVLGPRLIGAAFTLGVLVVLGLGIGTDLFDSGPNDVDVSAAYREGLELGETEATAEWEERLDQVWWEHYERGTEEANSMSPSMQRAVIDGFSWESGFAAGWDSVESASSAFLADYWRGWTAGYEHGRALVDGSAQPLEPQRALTVEWGGDT